MKVFYLNMEQLLPGMVVVDAITSSSGATVLEKNSVINTKSIAKLRLYKIEKVPVIIPASVSECIDKASVSHMNKVRETQEFKRFQRKYLETTEFLRNEFQRIADPEASDYDFSVLIDSIYSLIKDSYSATYIFDLLHCMRDYDDSTYVHSLNVALICNSIGVWMNYKDEDRRQLTLAGVIHDIGKLLVPTELINKPTRLSDEEFEIIKRHPAFGITVMHSYSLDERVRDAILMHHERLDGSGYPYGMTGESITSFARIVAIADVYDAMTALRSYRDSISPFEVVESFERDSYTKYDPAYLLPFLTRIVQAYIGVPVLLSNSLVGEVVMINQQRLSRPIVKVGTEFLDLSKELDITIRALV